MNKTFQFKGLLTDSGWLTPAYVQLDKQGRIKAVGTVRPETSHIAYVNGYALPGFYNAHSHAFQYAMAGLAEYHVDSARQDDFWSWREAMYGLALQLDPDQMEVIATMLYAEMLRHGYTHVAEFHYLHHDKNGKPYQQPAEMGERLIAAAQTAGINITLIPIFYQKGGFGTPPNERQRRFISASLDDYLAVWEASKKACSGIPLAHIGYGAHSLRGVESGEIKRLAEQIPEGLPFHIHVSEQLKEVADALRYLGQRPVEWMLNHLPMHENYHLVHATHLTPEETNGLAQSKAHVVLCPSTEGNLGDGLFPLKPFMENAGRWSMGTDSHIGLNPFEELRLLDYGQRLTTHQRNTFVSSEQGDSGMAAIEMVQAAGRSAMGIQTTGFFAIGSPFDAVVMDADAPLLAASSTKHLASTIVFASDVSMQLGTIVNGKWIVKDGQHVNSSPIRTRFQTTLRELDNR